MNKTQQIIADYYALSPKEKAVAVYEFHKEKMKEKRIPVPGHLDVGAWSIEDTAKEFHIATSMVSLFFTQIGKSAKKAREEVNGTTEGE